MRKEVFHVTTGKKKHLIGCLLLSAVWETVLRRGWESSVKTILKEGSIQLLYKCRVWEEFPSLFQLVSRWDTASTRQQATQIHGSNWEWISLKRFLLFLWLATDCSLISLIGMLKSRLIICESTRWVSVCWRHYCLFYDTTRNSASRVFFFFWLWKIHINKLGSNGWSEWRRNWGIFPFMSIAIVFDE